MKNTPIVTPEDYHEYLRTHDKDILEKKLIPNEKRILKARSKFGRRHIAGEMNNTEKRFLDEYITPKIQSGEWLDYWFESITLKLAADCRYTPDFMIQTKEGFLIMIEVKGTTKNKTGQEIPYSQDDSMVKVKVSPHHFPFEFCIAHPSKVIKGEWLILPK